MIKISDLEFRYREGDFHLRIPELAIDRGSRAAVIGPSGSGKTTLLHLVAGIAVPLSGCVEVGGADLAVMSDAARREFRITRIGMVFQEFELLEYLDVRDNILLPYRINPALILDRTVRSRAAELAGRMGIGDKLGRPASKLSQGEKQRVAVCRALLPEPELLLADEPTGNLDPGNKGRVLDLLLAYAAESGATLLTVTHDHDLLGRFGRVIDFKDFEFVMAERSHPGGALFDAVPGEGE